MFGTPTTPAAPSGGGLFGTPATPAAGGGGLFGASAPGAPGGGGGLFGSSTPAAGNIHKCTAHIPRTHEYLLIRSFPLQGEASSEPPALPQQVVVVVSLAQQHLRPVVVEASLGVALRRQVT